MALKLSILLFGIGVSSIGDFIYSVALNVIILAETHSAAAVAGLWVVPRMAALVVGPWAGSVTDRLSHRKQLVTVEIARALLIGILPLLSHMGETYGILFCLGACTTFFNNAFVPYQTLLVPDTHWKRVNAIASMLRNGAFLIGPAIAGLLLQRGDTSLSIWLDAISFGVSGITLLMLPELSGDTSGREKQALQRSMKADWREAIQFLKRNSLYTALFSLNAMMAIFAFTADSQEVVFATQALGLGQFGYGMMVVAAGIGFISGSFLLAVFAKHMRTGWLICVGTPLSAVGYLTYSLSYSFWWAVAGLLILGVFGSAASVGFSTYTQGTVPVTHMGRITNVLGPPQQILTIAATLIGGVIAEQYSIRGLMVGMTIPMCLFSLSVGVLAFLPKNRRDLSCSDQPAVVA